MGASLLRHLLLPQRSLLSMKLLTHIKLPLFTAIYVAMVLLVPNVVLDFTEPYSIGTCLANIFLPAGAYFLVVSIWKRIGITTLLLFPLMVMCAFQIVLLYLFGNGLIAVDMFLNVVTTNAGEIAELLGNLLISIGIVVVLYVPAICLAVIAIRRKAFLPPRQRRDLRFVGVMLAAIGVLCVGGTYRSDSFTPQVAHDIFPINVSCNLREAFHRWDMVEDYPQTSADFVFHARSLRADSIPELYILVIGETGRADHWQLGGYERATNPKLSQINGLTYFPQSLSQSNTTHKSVPLLLSHLQAAAFDSIVNVKSIVTAFKEAGYYTTFISNQLRNRSFTEYFSNEADTTLYIPSTGLKHAYDHEMLPPLENILASSPKPKNLVVLHTYGSHFLYSDRYPRQQARFKPDQAADAGYASRRELINAYDNSIIYTDSIIAQIIAIAQAKAPISAVIYSSDHGEDIYDDRRMKFLHASPKPTYYQLHVPTLVWLSEGLKKFNPEFDIALKENQQKLIAPQRSLAPTLLHIAAISTPYARSRASLADTLYQEATPIYLTDLNEAVTLDHAGMTLLDFDKLTPIVGKGPQAK